MVDGPILMSRESSDAGMLLDEFAQQLLQQEPSLDANLLYPEMDFSLELDFPFEPLVGKFRPHALSVLFALSYPAKSISQLSSLKYLMGCTHDHCVGVSRAYWSYA